MLYNFAFGLKTLKWIVWAPDLPLWKCRNSRQEPENGQNSYYGFLSGLGFFSWPIVLIFSPNGLVWPTKQLWRGDIWFFYFTYLSIPPTPSGHFQQFFTFLVNFDTLGGGLRRSNIQKIFLPPLFLYIVTVKSTCKSLPTLKRSVTTPPCLGNWKGWGLSAKLGKHSAIWGKLGKALQAYALNPCSKFPPNPTSRKVNT